MGVKGHLSGAVALALGLSASVFAQSGSGAGTQFELAFWQSVTGSDDPAQYEAYLQQYPSGTFSGLARAKLANLRKGSTPVSAPVQAPIPVPVPVPVAPVQLASTPAVVQPATAPLPQTAPAPAPLPVPAPPVPAAMPVSPLPASTAPAAPVLASLVPPPAPPKILPVRNNPVSEADDSALLEELAKSQEVGGSTMQVAAAQGFAVPPRPVMSEVPDLPLPTAFCSAEQRNAFHETRYKPVMEITRINNVAAVAHMQRLQQVYDSLQLARDINPMNAIAVEASAYQQEVATPVYNRQLAMVQKFDAIMAVPVTNCQVAAAK